MKEKNELIKSVQFQLTTTCNERCIFCRKYTWPKAEIPIEVIREKMQKYPNAYYQFSGGEPSMYSNLAKLNKLLFGKTYKVYTNGVFSKANKEVKKFFDNATEIAISFDAWNPDVYNEVRRPRSPIAFSIVKSNAVEYASKVKLSMVVTSENIGEIPDIIKFADKYKIKTRFYPIHTNSDGLIASREQIDELRKVLYDIDYDSSLTNVENTFKTDFYKQEHEFIPCKARNYSRLIDEQGNEYFCCYAINDNGEDICGLNAIPALNISWNESVEFNYCKRCTRYRKFNSEEVKPGPEFM